MCPRWLHIPFSMEAFGFSLLRFWIFAYASDWKLRVRTLYELRIRETFMPILCRSSGNVCISSSIHELIEFQSTSVFNDICWFTNFLQFTFSLFRLKWNWIESECDCFCIFRLFDYDIFSGSIFIFSFIITTKYFSYFFSLSDLIYFSLLLAVILVLDAGKDSHTKMKLRTSEIDDDDSPTTTKHYNDELNKHLNCFPTATSNVRITGQ